MSFRTLQAAIAGLALLGMANSALAVTVSETELVAGGTSLSDTGNVFASSSGLSFVGGIPFEGGTFSVNGTLDDGSLSFFEGGSPPLFPLPGIPGTQTIAGTLEDVAAGTGTIDLLFSVTGGTRLAEFDDGLLLVTLNLDPAILGTLGSIIFPQTFNDVDATFAEVRRTAVIPIPATAFLLLSGLLGFGLLGWRRRPS